MDAPRFLERQRLQLLERAERGPIFVRVRGLDIDEDEIRLRSDEIHQLEMLKPPHVGRGAEGEEEAA